MHQLNVIVAGGSSSGRARICSHFRGAHEAPARRRLAAGVGVDRFAPRPRSLLNPRMMLTVATRAIPFSLLGHGGGEGADLVFPLLGRGKTLGGAIPRRAA